MTEKKPVDMVMSVEEAKKDVDELNDLVESRVKELPFVLFESK